MEEGSELEELLDDDLPFDVKVLAGVTAPLGFWDPAGFSEGTEKGRVLFYREVELKHGRVAMLASIGFIVAEQFHPLFGGDIDVPSYIAFQETPLQTFWGAVLFVIALLELDSIASFESPLSVGGLWSLISNEGELTVEPAPFEIKAERIPGDLDFDPLGLRPERGTAELLAMQNRELNHGRLAMIGITGMVVQELVTHEKLF